MARLRSAKGASLRRFVALVDGRTQGGRTIPFRLTGHSSEAAPADLKGGFHRGSGSIFMDIGRVRPDEWMVIFIHEVAHGLDDLISPASRVYGQTEDVAELAAWAARTETPSDLPHEIREKLDSWLAAGLDRGLWAEYRAWLATFALYEDGARERLWNRVAWMEEISAQRPPELGWNLFLYRFLDDRFQDPTEGIFSRVLIRNGLRELRGRYRDLLPGLGSLGRMMGR
ncbi:MAG: hypothetical protein HUU37_01825 [Bdellovibrionales bacterium]|nr:hypothetical protein [Bdellovibrionales bacterium]